MLIVCEVAPPKLGPLVALLLVGTVCEEPAMTFGYPGIVEQFPFDAVVDGTLVRLLLVVLLPLVL